MIRYICGLVVVGVLAVTLGVAAQQASKSKTVTASVAVTTSNDRRNIAVLSKGEHPFLFCIDLATPLPKKITYTGLARVVYRPLPRSTFPPALRLRGRRT